MFKSKITVIVMLAGVVCSSLFMCVSGYPQGSEAWVPWAYPCAGGIVALIYILAFTGKKEMVKKE